MLVLSATPLFDGLSASGCLASDVTESRSDLVILVGDVSVVALIAAMVDDTSSSRRALVSPLASLRVLINASRCEVPLEVARSRMALTS